MASSVGVGLTNELVATTEPVLAAVLGLQGFAGPG
jgi:hypothetical protein